MKITRYWPLALALAIVPGAVAFYVFRPKVDPEEAMIRADSAKSGLDPEAMSNLYHAEMAIRKGGDYEKAWRTLEAQIRSSDTTQRLNAYSVVVLIKNGPLRPRALQAIESTKSDPNPEVRAKYPWNLMLINAPRWRETCQSLTTSTDAATTRYAVRALEMGKNKPDRND